MVSLREQLLQSLRQITKEEQKILDSGGKLQRAIYTSGSDFTIESKKMLSGDKLIDVRTHTRFVAFPKHKHNYIEIIYMCEGSTTHIVNDRDRIVLETGDLLLLNQHSYHEILPAGREDIGVNFIILPEFFHLPFDMMEEENVLSNFMISALTQDSGNATYLHFQVSGLLPVQNLVENLVWMLVEQQSKHERLGQITMGLLFLQLLGHTDKASCAQPEQYRRMIAFSALRYIEQHFCTGSLRALAEQLNQSVSALSHLIKEETGSTFSELMQRKRFEKAIDLICNTRLPLSDIISAVGYENTSYFYRTFKKLYGVSPKEYREAHSKLPPKKIG